MKPIDFNLSVRDIDPAITFFEAVLGWRFNHFEMPYPYPYYRNEPSIFCPTLLDLCNLA